MNKAEQYFIENIINILAHGTYDENPRPKYASDGTPAHSKFITQVFEKYDLQKNEFPITQLRPIYVDKGIKEIKWIFQDQTSDLRVLEEKYGIYWWRDWEVNGTNTIGKRYGATVREYNMMNRFLDGLINDPYGRRHIIDMLQFADLRETEGLFPCAFQVLGSVRNVGGVKYFDMTLTQRSSDYLIAGHINKMQYVAFMMMVAKHCGYQLGVFSHFVQNLHIYDRHIEQATTILKRSSELPHTNPILKLNVEDGTNFYDIKSSDFELVDYHPIEPQLKFDLGI